MLSEKINKSLENLPDSEGIFCLKDARNQTLSVIAASNVRKKAEELFPDKDNLVNQFHEQISSIEVLQGRDLIKSFGEVIRERKPVYNASIADEGLYPYLKITNEEFPRLLVTRKIADDGAEYYGAFLPATGVRFWLEFINRTFRLRTCEIEIDDNFPSPCTQFYVKRCVAPCVKSLCDRKTYLKFVELVRLFLQNKRERFREILLAEIEAAAENLEFEKAGAWRDILQATTDVFAAKDWQLWLDDAVDTFEVEKKDKQIFVYLITQRGRKTLGKKVFVFENKKNPGAKEVLSDVLWQFYQFHAPKEIRVPFDLPDKNLLVKTLSKHENHAVKFTIIRETNERKTSIQALKRAKFDFDFQQIKPPVKTEDILRELKALFHLPNDPQKIEAFDAAHISGSDFTAAKVAWEDGKFVTAENEFWLSDETSELETLQKAIGARFVAKGDLFPDLLLIDGGRSQLQAAIKALNFLENRRFAIVGAVKPPRQHGSISHFILENGSTVKFSDESEAMRILLRLRDEAHDLANKIHRQRRETSHFYELARILPSITEGERRELLQKFGSLKQLSQANREELESFLDTGKARIILKDIKAYQENSLAAVKPLIVPIRFDDPNGEAKSLQPLNYIKIS